LSSRKKLKTIENTVNPDCIFSVFGPSWWSPQKPHLMGFAYPHYVYKDSPFFSRLSNKAYLKIKLFEFIHRKFLRRNGSYFVCETADVSSRLKDFLKISSDKIFTVTNTCNNYFNDFVLDDIKILPPKLENEFRFLSVCSFAPHKNLEILNEVIERMSSKLDNIKFVLTVNQDLFDQKFNELSRKYIVNVGPIDVSKCPQLYSECDALFLPTLLECSTANYPEAFKMKLPVLTSNLPFATNVCGNAAMYFNPVCPDDIAQKINHFITSADLRKKLVKNGSIKLLDFLTAKERCEAYLEICKKIIVNEE
jgi:glycosyltransferase involved in cell wall biosynthesis